MSDPNDARCEHGVSTESAGLQQTMTETQKRYISLCQSMTEDISDAELDRIDKLYESMSYSEKEECRKVLMKAPTAMTEEADRLAIELANEIKDRARTPGIAFQALAQTIGIFAEVQSEDFEFDEEFARTLLHFMQRGQARAKEWIARGAIIGGAMGSNEKGSP